MQHVLARQVKRARDFCASRRFFVPLFLYDVSAHGAQLYACKCMDAVVDARVAGLLAAGHSTVCRVYDRVYFKRGNIALPKVKDSVPVCGNRC